MHALGVTTHISQYAIRLFRDRLVGGSICVISTRSRHSRRRGEEVIRPLYTPLPLCYHPLVIRIEELIKLTRLREQRAAAGAAEHRQGTPLRSGEQPSHRAAAAARAAAPAARALG